jgi:hypothetical protein
MYPQYVLLDAGKTVKIRWITQIYNSKIDNDGTLDHPAAHSNYQGYEGRHKK